MWGVSEAPGRAPTVPTAARHLEPDLRRGPRAVACVPWMGGLMGPWTQDSPVPSPDPVPRLTLTILCPTRPSRSFSPCSACSKNPCPLSNLGPVSGGDGMQTVGRCIS